MSSLLIPKRITIETVFGCNSNCEMCVVNHPTKRKKGVMPEELFTHIIECILPYKDKLEMMDLYCLGEPLLDPHIFRRIRYVKQRGFRNVGISTNADLLDREKQKLLLESGIDTVLFSIDGVKKETHEKVRRGVDFNRVVENCQSILRMREKGGYKTRFVIRFIRQDSNREEWEPFKKYWIEKISTDKNDFITAYDMHTWGGDLTSKAGGSRNPEIEEKPCDNIFDVLYILSDGSVPLCHEDWLHPKYNFGNVRNRDPIEIWNNDEFRKVREIHRKGRKNTIIMCRECTVLYSIPKKEIIN